MNPWEKELLDAFLEEEELVGAGACALTEALGGVVVQDSPDAGLRAKMLAGATDEGRFERFRSTVARMMDVGDEAARALLAGLAVEGSFEPSPLPNVSLYHIEGGPAVEPAVTGFVRIPAGGGFPEHTHMGPEAVFVLQGSLEDSRGAIVRPGELAEMTEGSAHSFVVRPGPDLVYLFVAQGGIKIGDEVYGPDHPDT